MYSWHYIFIPAKSILFFLKQRRFIEDLFHLLDLVRRKAMAPMIQGSLLFCVGPTKKKCAIKGLQSICEIQIASGTAGAQSRKRSP